MLAKTLKAFAINEPDAPAIVVGSNTHSYAALGHRIEEFERQYGTFAGAAVGLWIDNVVDFIAAAAALDSIGASVVLGSASMSRQQVDSMRQNLELKCVLTDTGGFDSAGFTQLSNTASVQLPSSNFETRTESPRLSQIILFTSGTSGEPKPAIFTWDRLAAGINQSPRYGSRRWLFAYDPTRFAGIQVWLQALLTGGCLCVPASRDPADVAQLLVDQRVQFASATPSFWRLLLSTVEPAQLAQAELTQITLGGEAVDQAILDRLRSAFPSARLTHIYASTEMGVCFSVNDAQAGFPAEFLVDSRLPCQLRISESGELEIRSRRAMLGYLSGEPYLAGQDKSGGDAANWFPTGDLVQQNGNRVYFVGRKSETINVGGQKVYPSDVEQCIRSVSGVQQVRVCGMPSSLTGQLVKAEVEPMPSVDHDILRREIFATCRSRLSRHQLPATIEFVDHILLSPSGKLTRAEADHGK